MTLAALIFDVDGTLADTERDGHRVAYNEAFREAGLDWEWTVPLYGRLLDITGGKERIRHFIETERPDFSPPGPMDEYIAQLHRVKTDYYTQLIRSGDIPLRPGVERLLKEARNAGLRMAIATTTTPDNVEALIEITLGSPVQDWFEVLGAGDVVPSKKPAPDIYNYVLERLSLSSASCLAFEDSFNGLLSARAAGLKTIITVNEYTRDQDFTGATLVLDQLGTPNEEFKTLAGASPNGAKYVDVKFLRSLHST